MGIEIERKFLVDFELFKTFIPKCEKMTLCSQGYLNTTNSDITTRVRLYGDKGFLTIKTCSLNNISRNEYEYEIPYDDAKELIFLCKNIIKKYRYIFIYNDKKWEIDVFMDDNKGLIVAEIELDDENEFFKKPSFIKDEVTFDKRYTNLNLSITPFNKW